MPWLNFCPSQLNLKVNQLNPPARQARLSHCWMEGGFKFLKSLKVVLSNKRHSEKLFQYLFK